MGRDVTAMGLHVTDVGLEKKEQLRELKKHAATIHCSNSLSLLQRKVSNALLYHAYKELLLKEEHEITVKQLCRLIGYHGNNHSAIRDALKGLISTVIEWNLINDETGAENWTASSIIASVSLEGPLCYYAYSPRMKQLLHSPSMFGKIDLVIQSKFRSSYGLALYENCIRYRGLPHTKWFEMELFKKLMGVVPGKYDIFRDFKRRVLDKAIDEVNTYSDLVISSEVVKEGRKVIKIRFTLKDRAKKTRLGNPNALNVLPLQAGEDGLIAQLQMVFGLSSQQIEQLLTEYQREYIQEKISIVETSKPYQEGRVENLTGYLLSALKNNYQAAKVKANQPINMQEAKQALALAELKQIVEDIRQAYQAYRERLIHEAIDALPVTENAVFMQRFLELTNSHIQTILQLQRHKYTRENVLDSPQMKAQLRQFALRELDLLNIISLEEFVASQADAWREAWQKLKSLDPEHVLLRFQE
jgi:plasmid replication initiation protein